MAAPIFFGALAALISLFLLRYFEERRGMRFAPRMRRSLDRLARIIKAIALVLSDMLEHVPQIVSYLLRALAVSIVRRFAHMTESLSRAAHSVADMVSYKHRFERRETRSDFLKKMSRPDERSADQSSNS